MRKAIILTAALITTLVLAIAAGALAASPKCDDPDSTHPSCKPTTTTSTTTTVPDDGLRTCLDVGTAWNLGWWDPDAQAYKAETLPICIDLNADPDHLNATDWIVTWSGTSGRTTKHGAEAKLLFEEQLHENWYAECVVTLPSESSGSDTWQASLSLEGTVCGDAGTTDPNPRSLVFVAMPRSGPGWTSFSVTIEPQPAP